MILYGLNLKIFFARRCVSWCAASLLLAAFTAASAANAQPSLSAPLRKDGPPVLKPSHSTIQIRDRVSDAVDVSITRPRLPPQSIVTISPQSGIGGTQVALRGTRRFGRAKAAKPNERYHPIKLSVMFGALPAAYAGFNSDGTITAAAPYVGQPGKSVRISVQIDKDAPIYSLDLFSYPIAHMEVTGPMPYTASEVGDSRWASGRGHMMLNYAPDIVTFSEQPTFHVSISFVDDTMAVPAAYNPPTAVGNFGVFDAHLQNCDVSRPSAPGLSQCKNWDGNMGTWTDATPSVSKRLDRSNPDVSVSGDLALTTTGLFDQANLVRTLRVAMSLQENDTNRSIGADRLDSKIGTPFTAVVAPSAFIQVKVIPFTIVYQPPGNASTAFYQTTNTYSTSFKMGNSTEQNNSSSTQLTASTKASIKLTIPLSGSSVGFGIDLGESWDNSTKTGFGTAEGTTDTATNTYAFQTQWNLLPNPDLIPGSGATCISATDCSSETQPENPRAIEPFWGDTFVFLVHPQFAMWVLDAGQTRYVEISAVPVTADATVAQLAACWTGSTTWPNGMPCRLSYSESILQSKNGAPLGYGGSLKFVTLTAEEAHRFLLLDPFFVNGQSSTIAPERGISFGSPQYGAMIGQRPRPITETLSHTLINSSEKTGSATTTLSVTSVRGTDSTYNVSESLFGMLGLTGTVANGTKLSTSADMKTTYNTSTAVTVTNATQSQVMLNDQDTTVAGCNLPHCHLPLKDRPSVQIFQDKQFGGFMFRDPGATSGPGSIALNLDALRTRVEFAVAAVKSGLLKSAQPVLDASRNSRFVRKRPISEIAQPHSVVRSVIGPTKPLAPPP